MNEKPPSVIARPLSPHLQVYRPMLTMMMSITHRLTGCLLYGGMAVLTLWLMSAAMSADCFYHVSAWLLSWPGLIGLFLLSWALIHHALGGLRHFLWDTGHGFALPVVEKLALANIIGSVTLTVLLWLILYGVRA